MISIHSIWGAHLSSNIDSLLDESNQLKMATHFDRLNMDILTILKPYLGKDKEVDRFVIDQMTQQKHLFTMWIGRAITIGIFAGFTSIVVGHLNRNEFGKAFSALLAGVPCVGLILDFTEYIQIKKEQSVMAMQEERIKSTLKLLEQSKNLNK